MLSRRHIIFLETTALALWLTRPHEDERDNA